ncbi:hypothetical protein SUGI_0092010 [Cryptomeria japonica]|nr:hypothetical protein SUGI_0092010 [Cryptomeria japonica]
MKLCTIISHRTVTNLLIQSKWIALKLCTIISDYSITSNNYISSDSKQVDCIQVGIMSSQQLRSEKNPVNNCSPMADTNCNRTHHHGEGQKDLVGIKCNRICTEEEEKKFCLCSPTTHPGSFRCRLHRN